MNSIIKIKRTKPQQIQMPEIGIRDTNIIIKLFLTKKNPGKNHIVLFQYPIIKEPKIFEGTGKIIWIRTVKHKVCIKYEFAIISPTGDDVWKSESVEFLPIEYYESLQKIKNNNLTLTIFITRLKDRVYPWIDRTVLDD